MPAPRLIFGGRDRSAFDAAVERLGGRKELGEKVDFVELDAWGSGGGFGPQASQRLQAVMKEVSPDLVLHAAGPFQGRDQPLALEAALGAGVAYVDVCDDTELCRQAKGLGSVASDVGVPAVVSAGIWPGVSALLVAEAAARLPQGHAERAQLSFFTAGTGGAGPTIVSATFLLLAERPLVYRGGQAQRPEPWSARRLVDFGPGVGERYVHLLDEPECYTCHECLGVPTIDSSFGTAPEIWNQMFAAVQRIVPPTVLANKALMQALAVFSMPIIRAVDTLVGSTNAMRVDAYGAGGKVVTLRVTHPDLESCVGIGTAAFAVELLKGGVEPGVWFPAEMSASRAAILRRARTTSILWEV